MNSQTRHVAQESLFWGYLIHLGVNMWSDREAPDPRKAFEPGISHRASVLSCDKRVWDRIVEELAEAGFTHLVIDLGDGVRYASHPEIGIEGAWSTDFLQSELARIRELGIEPIPKLNFSTGHSTWMGQYARLISSPAYYGMCRDLIQEVSDIFGGPQYFHLGMDEETESILAARQYAVIRRDDLWWSDLEFLCERVREMGARPWVWSDPAWHNPDDYYSRMSKDVLQSNWYYGLWFEGDETNRPRALQSREAFLTYLDLDDHRYDQVPTASSWHNSWDNLDMTVDYCRDRLAPARLKGFLQAPWITTIPEKLDLHLRTIRLAAATIARHASGQPQ